MTIEDIGIVIIGRNEGERLIRCLNSAKMCASVIVYVNSGSTDRSIENAKEIGAHVVELDPTSPFTAARARNEGYMAIRKLKPTISLIQFVDGDCCLAPQWLEVARAFLMEHGDVAIACGRRRERYPESSIYNYLCDEEWNTPIGESQQCGGDALMRVDAFEAVGGFRSDVTAGEEPELCLRLRKLGWKIWRLNEEMTEHDAAMTRFRQWWLRAVRSGYGLANIIWLHRRTPADGWFRMLTRAIFWGGVLPICIGIGALFHPIVLLGFLVYVAQIVRLALRAGPNFRHAWLRAYLLTVTKIAEFLGILRFFWTAIRVKNANLIEYK